MRSAWTVDGDTEAKFVTEGLQRVDSGFCVVAEAEVFAFVKLDDMKTIAQDEGCEVSSAELAELLGEGKDDRGIDACIGQKA